MKVITAIYDGREIKPAEPIKTKKETKILMLFPDDNEKDVEKITPEKARMLLKGFGKGEKLVERLLKARVEVRIEN